MRVGVMTEPTIVVWDEIEDWSEFKAEVLKIATADPRNVAKRDELATKAEAKWHGAHDAVFGIYAGALAKVEAEEAEAAAKLEVVVAPLEKAEPKIKRRKVAVPPVGPKADFAGALAAMIAARRAKETEAKPDGNVEAKEAEDLFISPAMQPSVEPEAEEVEEPEEDDPVLSKQTPMLSAREFARRRCRQQDFLATYFYKDDFWKWNGRHYQAIGEAEINAEIYAFLDRAKVAGVGNELTRFQLMPRDAEAVLKCLKAGLVVGLTPMQRWLDSGKAAPNVIAFKNCLVDYETGEVSALTPKLWITDGVDFAFDPGARCPRWEQFLEEVFPGDLESQQCIEEQLGYGMTNETKFEKGALWIGKRRSGKSTIAFVLKNLVGERSHIGLSFHTWLKNENSGSAMIGKKAGVFADVRLKPSVHYGRTGFDPGGIDHVSAEQLLKIIGRDAVSLGEKYERKPWEGELWIKIYVLSNEVPNLQDAGGVLASRFIKLEFRETFWGREDPNLRAKLRAELPGIANRCLAAYRRLCARGGFIQPKAGLELERKIEARVNPHSAFMQDCWVKDGQAEGPTVGEFYTAFATWCMMTDREYLLGKTPRQLLIQRINELDEWAWLKSSKPHGKLRRYAGIKRKPREDAG